MSKSRELTIPLEVADGITVATLKDYRKYLKSELKQYKNNPRTADNPKGYYLHPEDVTINTQIVEAMNVVIKYFGE